MFGDLIFRIQDIRDSNGGYCQSAPSILNLKTLSFNFEKGIAILELEEENERWTDVCRIGIQRSNTGDLVTIFYPSWADQEGD